MVKVVADTNIFISALFWRGNPYKFIHICFEGKAKLVVSRQIIDELERILLTDGKFELPREDVALYSEIILSHADFVSPAFTLNVIVKDPADDRILECAVEGEVDYLVSGTNIFLMLRNSGG